MKTKLILFRLLIFSFLINNGNAQTIAVADFSTNGVHATPEIAGKLARLELVKINKYVVMDESDMDEMVHPDSINDCYGKNCLIDLGQQLNVPLILCGSIDGLGNKIVISLKLIDVRNQTVKASKSMEFDNQEVELQRMIGIVIKEMHDIAPDEEIKKQLAFKNEVIISNNVGKINNSGPRMGFAFIHDSELYEFYERKEIQGGLEIFPAMTNLGYQFEGQYIGTENFSALAEIIFNVGGMEQGRFIPSMSVLNGFRFGAQGWEFAFGPSFGFRRTSLGSFDINGNYSTAQEQRDAHYKAWANDPNNYDENGYPINTYEGLPNSMFSEHLDTRGDLQINTNWLMAFGRTFKAGALNIPVNVYYSYNKFGGAFGASVGFNVTKSKTAIH